MKLLIFIHSLSFGGAERVAVNLANYWAEKGWGITIVTIAGQGQGQDFYSLHPDIRRIALGLDTNSVNVFAGMLHNLRRVSALRKVLRQEKPDVALAMMTTANCLLALAAARTRIPTIGSERIHPPEFPLDPIWSWLRRRLYPRLSAVTALTQETALWLKEHAGVERVVVIPNPVPYPLPVQDPRIMPENVLDSMPDGRMLLAVGRLDSQKGFDRLLVAFSELALRFPNWRLAIVGEGDCRGKLERQVADLGLQGRVFLPGTAGNIGDWYEAADIYVMTSRFEGFPNTLVEALAHGLPAVSVDCDTGPRDILCHDIDGLLVPQDDMDALVKALATLMRDDKLRRRYAARAIEARERFSLERICGMWERLFEELLCNTSLF